MNRKEQYLGINAMEKVKLGQILHKCTSLIEEDQPLLFSEEYYKSGDYSKIPCETAIVQGATKLLKKWPSHLCAAFLTGCLTITLIIIFILMTISFSIPAIYQECRKSRNVEIEESNNVYFVKQENRTWSRKELCYIETAARKHPDLNVYMVNLVSEDSQKNDSPNLTHFNYMKVNTFSSLMRLYDRNAEMRNSRPETLLRKKIAYHNFNVRNIDISTERFFRGSMLYKVHKKLSYKMLEIAAKVCILWNYPGIALNPVMYNSLNDLQQYFCDKNKKTCRPEQNFTIELKGDLQASGIPCHAFAGFFMQQIIKNQIFDQQHGLENILDDFCPRIEYCPGVKIVETNSSYSSSEIYCPTVYPNGPFADFDEYLN